MPKERLDLILAIVQIAVLVVQIASLIALIIYVKKTAEMASATKDMADASRKSADISEQMTLAAKHSAEATARSAKAAEDSLLELRETREQESAPYVVAYFDASVETALIYLIIKNIGRTVAHDVRLDFEPALQNSTAGIEIANIPLIKDGVRSIPPGFEIRTLFDSAISYYGNESSPLSYTVTISYSGGLRDEVRSYKQTLDLGAFKDLTGVRQKGMSDLVTQVEGVAKAQLKINAALEYLGRKFKQGLWIRNQDFLIKTVDSQESFWPQQVFSKLIEFQDFWISIERSEEDINLRASGIQSKCLLISEQILAALSNRPANVADDVIEDLRMIVAKLAEMGRLRFYLDGGNSDERFINIGNSIIEKIEEMNTKLFANTERV